jgi:hypothetical protein
MARRLAVRTLLSWLERRRRSRSAEAAAVTAAARHFEVATGERPHAGLGAAIGREPRGTVVRICHGATRPPQRAWYVVSAEGTVVAELSFEDAARFGERPWR